ncbi:lipid-A-disaccharide kinase [Persephonella hydrogeniphila]|uniref:Tetraacyldisaccharide 4'-kinase n=1 Tax=Persephonella hydrogeniphila TaxID=198703 RepID=A0A285NGM4_9AQUI|nr:tetraacyldisaccharide 4'-kinase [Persephonella hydrogeniphila]SNZ08662.1 lipid-A-disaccharide kinase [Persephonella hydrogeniphila]
MLKILSKIYGSLAKVRRYTYEKGLIQKHKLPIPVISIGNLSVGGTGKTPLTIFTAKKLIERGYSVTVLSRGYKRKSRGTVIVRNRNKILVNWEEAGDEPFLIAKNNIPVVVSENRYAAGLKAIEEINPDIFILDDGFQHFQLHRDVNILVFDATKPFWEDSLLPSGRLREPPEFYRYADILIINRLEKVENKEEIISKIQKLKKKFFISQEKIDGLTDLENSYRLETLSGKNIGVFSGLGNNPQFFNTVEKLSKKIGFKITEKNSYPDHYDYSQLQLSNNPDLWLTTEKDIIKIRPEYIKKYRIMALKYTLKLDEDFINYLEKRIFYDKVKNSHLEYRDV